MWSLLKQIIKYLIHSIKMNYADFLAELNKKINQINELMKEINDDESLSNKIKKSK